MLRSADKKLHVGWAMEDVLRPQSQTSALAAGVLSAGSPNGESCDWLAIQNSSFVTSAAFPAANLAIYQVVHVEMPVVIKQMGWLNGATASGNIDVGIYTFAGTRLVNSGTIAQTGTSTIQVTDITDTALAPGSYFLALQGSATTLTFLASAQAARRWRMSGFHEQAVGSFGLPATATFATYARAYGLAILALTNAVA